MDSHKNKGLGIGFLRHAERCSTLAMVLDLSEPEPWNQLEALRHELRQFSPELAERPQLIIANKIDLPNSKVSNFCVCKFSHDRYKKLTIIIFVSFQENFQALEKKLDTKVIPISGKTGENVTSLLTHFQVMHVEYERKKLTCTEE